MKKRGLVRLMFLSFLGLAVWTGGQFYSNQAESPSSSTRIDQTSKSAPPLGDNPNSESHRVDSNAEPARQNEPVNSPEEPDLQTLLIKLRAQAQAGDVEAECKFSVVLNVCAEHTQQWRENRRLFAALSIPPEKLPGFTEENYAQTLVQHRRTYESLIVEQAERQTSLDACSSQAPDALDEYVDLLVHRANRNDAQSIAKLVDLSDQTLTQLAVERPEWIALHAKLIATAIQNPGDWIAFSNSRVLQGISDALYENANTSVWWNSRFPPNPELSYLYLLLSTTEDEQLITIIRASGAQEWANDLDESQIEQVALLIELESQLQASTAKQLQAKAKSILQAARALRLRAAQQIKTRMQVPELGDRDAWMRWRLALCEMKYD